MLVKVFRVLCLLVCFFVVVGWLVYFFLGMLGGVRISEITWTESSELGEKARKLGLNLANRNKKI